MLRFQPMTGLLASALLLVGCGSSFRVSKGDTPVNGIPFFVKTAVCEQSTVYVYPFYVITYQTLLNSKVQTAESVTISAAVYNTSKDVNQLLEILRKKDILEIPDITSANKFWSAIKQTHVIEPYVEVAAGAGIHPVANTATAKVLVDYANQYTLNARIPLAGSVNATYKLSGDGTLTEGSAQVADKTFETILGFFSESLKTAATGGALKSAEKPAEGAKPPPDESRFLQGTVEKRALKITYSQIRNFTVGCDVTTVIQPNKTGGFVIEEIGAKPAPQKDEVKTKDNEITVSGKITLPEKSKGDGDGGGAGGGESSGSKTPGNASPPVKE